MTSPTIPRSDQLTRIGTKYALERPLGSGGMGTVYLGFNEDLQITVAVKVMSEELSANPLLRDKFVEEGRKQARLKHPNALPVYDSGRDGSLLYLVMEYADGGSLAERIGRQTISTADAAKIVGSIASAVAKAHSLEEPIIHLDIKPANILFSEGVPKLADFGIARRILAGQGAAPTLVAFAENYAAPEQMVGRPVAKSDVFALGTVLFQLLAGDRWEKTVVADGESAAFVERCLPKEGRVYLDLIVACLDAAPDRRPTAAEVAARLLPAQGVAARFVRYAVAIAAVASLGAILPVTPLGTATFWQDLWPRGSQSIAFAPTPTNAALYVNGQWDVAAEHDVGAPQRTQ
jgi:serine/threonine-protein kinase